MGNQSKLDNHKLRQSPDNLSLYDSRQHPLYPLTYASEHKQSFDFLKFSKKVNPFSSTARTTMTMTAYMNAAPHLP